MRPANLHRQALDQPVLIGGWASDDDFGIHPKGSQPKRTLICPDDCDIPFLIPGHSYIFKTSKKKWQEQQAWSEVIAYRIGVMAGLDMPRCFICKNDNTGETGVLMEFFFAYPGDKDDCRLVHGSNILTRIIKDKKRGRPHSLRANISLCKVLSMEKYIDWWGKVITFDALIGNSDRHPDNWGFLIRRQADKTRTQSFAPVFDNGTSLGYEQPEAKLSVLAGGSALMSYVQRGTHHCSWDLSRDEPAPHIQLCKEFLGVHPDAGAAMRNVIRFDMAEVERVLQECVRCDVGIQFTAERARFMLALIRTRRALLAAALED